MSDRVWLRLTDQVHELDTTPWGPNFAGLDPSDLRAWAHLRVHPRVFVQVPPTLAEHLLALGLAEPA